MRKFAFVLAVLFASALTAKAAPPYNYTLAGASPGGLWTSLGVGIDGAIKTAYAGSNITYQTSGGGIANVGLLQQQKAQMGIVHDAELKIAVDGTAPFNKPVTDLRMLANMYDWAPMFAIMTKAFADQHGIKTFDDIAVKKPPLRLALNKRGNIANNVGEQMLKAIGVSIDDIKKWGGQVTLAASSEQTDLMKDRRADLIINSLFVRHGSLLELEQAVDIVHLPLSKKVIDQVTKEAGIKSFTIPAGSYKLQPEPVATVTLSAGVVVNAAMDEKTAYDLTKALAENIGKIKEVHKSMQALTPQLMASQTVIPFHPGAVRYYKEAGLLK
ncbi:MAG: TAXI family TRAP transporter solute-binding subunit [Burkholderiales bacterium]|nr:TAXI family TRAP transporter solute-binding subunit [Burkholderiales bacterium]